MGRTVGRGCGLCPPPGRTIFLYLRALSVLVCLNAIITLAVKYPYLQLQSLPTDSVKQLPRQGSEASAPNTPEATSGENPSAPDRASQHLQQLVGGDRPRLNLACKVGQGIGWRQQLLYQLLQMLEKQGQDPHTPTHMCFSGICMQQPGGELPPPGRAWGNHPSSSWLLGHESEMSVPLPAAAIAREVGSDRVWMLLLRHLQ